MRPKVDLADVVVAQHRGVSGVGGVVSSTVVDGAAGGEGQARLQPVLLDEPPGAVLQPLAGSQRQNKDTDQLLPPWMYRKNCPLGSAMKPLSQCPQLPQLHLTRCQSWSCRV